MTLRSGDVTLQLFKRTTGWGWGELVGADGTFLGVLDHFGELELRDVPVPMRLEVEDLNRTRRVIVRALGRCSLHGAGDLGAASLGSERGDAILPGIDWAIGREWTSGDNGFRDPWSMRAVPPVDSVAIPTMVVSRDSVFGFLPS